MYHVTLLYPEHIANTYGEVFFTSVDADHSDEAIIAAKSEMVESYVEGGGIRDELPFSDISTITVIDGGEPV